MSIEAMRNAVEAMDKHDFEMADHILCQAIAEAEKQEQGEPVAITTGTYGGRFTYVTNKPNVILPNGMALFASPQQRTWVELTEEDFVCVHQLCDTPIQAAEYVNHLLKEKNNA